MKLHPKLHKGKTGIYCIRNTENNKVYIGKALNIYLRAKSHITNLNRKVKKQENDYFINAWHKYGADKFEYFVLEYTEKDDTILSDRELFWMKEYDSTNPLKGYNLRMDSGTRMIVHESTRKKYSDNMKARSSDPEYRKKIGKMFSDFWKNNPEIKKQMSINVAIATTKYFIIQYDKQMNFIRKWNYLSEITNEFPTYKRHNIYAVCSGEKPSIYGFVWRKELKIKDIVQS